MLFVSRALLTETLLTHDTVGDMLAHELLPESLMDACLDVLKETTPSEREIIRIVVEIINELRDSAGGTDNEDTGNESVRARSPFEVGTDIVLYSVDQMRAWLPQIRMTL